MADVITCPLCGKVHPAGTTWCMTLFAEIPPQRSDPPAQATGEGSNADVSGVEPATTPRTSPSLPPAPEPPTEISAGRAVCSDCGDSGRPGEECRQCGHVIPSSASSVVTSVRSARAVVLTLPSGSYTQLPRGREIGIGRQSELGEIRAALTAFDAVSRQHCYVTVHPHRDEVTVRDPDSLNRTWVGADPREVGRQENRVAPLPVRLRLGHDLSIMIGLDGAS